MAKDLGSRVLHFGSPTFCEGAASMYMREKRGCSGFFGFFLQQVFLSESGETRSCHLYVTM